MERQRFDSVWDAIEDTPAEATNMRICSDLMIAIERRVVEWNLPAAEAARRLGVTQPRLSELMRGNISRFTLNSLIAMATQAGFTVRLEVAEAA